MCYLDNLWKFSTSKMLSDNLKSLPKLVSESGENCIFRWKITPPPKTIDQRNDFAPLQGKLSSAVENRRPRVQLSREQNFQRRSQSLRLQFAPKFALFATHAVHDLRDVAEMLPKLLFQDFSFHAVEHDTLVEMVRKWPGNWAKSVRFEKTENFIKYKDAEREKKSIKLFS